MQRGNRYLGIFCLSLAGLWFGNAQAVVINEIRIDQTGADSSEYFELAGSAGESLANLSYLVIGDNGSDSHGIVESVTQLSGHSLATDGFFLAAEGSFALGGGVDLVTSLNFENSDNVTHLLVSGFSGALGDDLDTNNDGSLDVTPWLGILDSVALVETYGSGDGVYSPHQVGAGNGTVPAHVFRSPDGNGAWQIGTMDTAEDTAGRANVTTAVPEPPSLALLALGVLVFGAQRLKWQSLRGAAAV
jgi:hypothetical protein